MDSPELAAPSPALPAREVYTVSRLALEVRALLEGGFPLLWVEGEIANLTLARSGHVYFTLCDAHAQVRCVMWRSVARLLERPPASGEHVLARVRVGFYEARGEFQLDVQHVEPAGEGALLRAIEERRRRLAAEGLFDVQRKRPLPALPRRLAVITSPHGAALHDVLTTLQRRWPALEVTVLGAPVQGAGAPPALVHALARAPAHGEVVLLVRGGGALEDLMAFNDEAVVRAVAACAVPVVCGVGHEVDVTLADLAADRRTPTPTAAAELVVPDRAEWLARLVQCEGRLAAAARRRVRMSGQRVDELERRLRHPAQRVALAVQRLTLARGRLIRATRAALGERQATFGRLEARLHGARPALRLALARGRLERAAGRLHPAWQAGVRARTRALAGAGGRLHALSPLATLGRGYALATGARGEVLRDAAQAPPGSAVSVRLARGRLGCVVHTQEPE